MDTSFHYWSLVLLAAWSIFGRGQRDSDSTFSELHCPERHLHLDYLFCYDLYHAPVQYPEPAEEHGPRRRSRGLPPSWRVSPPNSRRTNSAPGNFKCQDVDGRKLLLRPLLQLWMCHSSHLLFGISHIEKYFGIVFPTFFNQGIQSNDDNLALQFSLGMWIFTTMSALMIMSIPAFMIHEDVSYAEMVRVRHNCLTRPVSPCLKAKVVREILFSGYRCPFVSLSLNSDSFLSSFSWLEVSQNMVRDHVEFLCFRVKNCSLHPSKCTTRPCVRKETFWSW